MNAFDAAEEACSTRGLINTTPPAGAAQWLACQRWSIIVNPRNSVDQAFDFLPLKDARRDRKAIRWKVTRRGNGFVCNPTYSQTI